MKVWIYKGDVVGGKRELTAAAPSADRPRPSGPRHPSASQWCLGHDGDEHRGPAAPPPGTERRRASAAEPVAESAE